MNVRLKMYKYCYLNLGAIYAKGLYVIEILVIIKCNSEFESDSQSNSV